MTQIFHRSFNVISKATIFGGLGILVLLTFAGYELVFSSYTTNAYIAVEQPIQFSHEHHVSGLGIDCRYCHTSAEYSPNAGMPTTKTCMNCHSQIWIGSELLAPVRESYRTGQPIEWNRVHQLGDFVHFNHAIHVAKGIGCSSCHGHVERMPLAWKVASLRMAWCLDCHRQPETNVRPISEIYNMAWDPAQDPPAQRAKLAQDYHLNSEMNCSICHY